MSNFYALNIAVLTVSDTRTADTDTSGRALVAALTTAGHALAAKTIVKDDIYQIRAACSAWIADPQVNAIVITGGTGFAGRDSTPEAVTPLLDKEITGFGELFRQVSYQDIGTSTMQSRALAGLANFTVLFCLPGSNNACTTGWRLIAEQLDARHKPCNFVELLQQKAARP
jgi:molybdopterin adenylyltransferase